MSYIGNQPVYQAFVTDQFSGNGSTTAFTMSVAPANTASVLVAVSGVLQDPSTYSVSGTTLTFSAAPPSGTGNISARYLGIPASGVTTTAYRTVTEFTATAGQTTFTPPSYTAGYINVYRNGTLLGSADYTATNGTTVVLVTGAAAGDLITTESFYVSSVLNAIPAVANAVTSTYLNTGAVTQTKLGTNVTGNGPAFFAYQTSPTTLATGVYTKITFDAELFDTNSNFASSRFTPTVAGYYQINSAVALATYSSGEFVLVFQKNGSDYTYPIDGIFTRLYSSSGSTVVYLNGSTDYVEVYAYQSNGVSITTQSGSSAYTSFSASMVRSA